jgi:beta-ketoacyl synthase-like protein
MGQEAHRAYCTQASGVAVRGWGLLTGWGTGLQSLPTAPSVAAQGQRLLPVTTPDLASERLRRATRECLLGVAAVQAALDDSHLARHEVAGARTALVYASASSYAAANWTFATSATENALHFPYTAPSAVPAEVTIQFGITGPYLTLLSGANAGIEALWQAMTLLTMAQCDRVVVLAVETFQECAELYTTGRWLLGTPLLESAACLILERHPSLAAVRYRAAWGTHGLATLVESECEEALACVYLCTPTARAGQMAGQYLQARWPDIALASVHERLGICLACAPLIAMMLAVTAGRPADVLLISQWWDAWAMVRWPGLPSQVRRASK